MAVLPCGPGATLQFRVAAPHCDSKRVEPMKARSSKRRPRSSGFSVVPVNGCGACRSAREPAGKRASLNHWPVSPANSATYCDYSRETLERSKGECAILAGRGRSHLRRQFLSTCGASGTPQTVEAESVYEAAVKGVRRFREDPWVEQVGPATVLDIEVREPSTKHAISLQQVERWLAGGTTNPTEASRKARLKMILVQG